MNVVLPQHTLKSSMCQDNVVKFLPSHKKYRMFWWEFCSTLLDYLYRTQRDKYSDYTKNNLILTYSIVTFVSFAPTHRATFTAAAPLEAILFEVVTTAAIGCHKAKRKGKDKLMDQLELLGEMPRYWWWTWSSKISEVVLTENQKKSRRVFKLVLALFTSVLTHCIIFNTNIMNN
ncbi:hypothetical protein [Wolbachia endosymbiont (group A) of Pogonocherus hispidulus]|uniref:hypothetical protein n=1 Tax=Wolbachia endosymbiont (group A) of Pogonocherus hispidulus TaxID=3066136 RepID=UPI003340A844